MDCGICTSKAVLLFLSLIFWAAGAFLGYVAHTMIKTIGNFETFLKDQNSFIPAIIIIAIAVFMFIFGLIGCCATIRESKVGLSCFLIFIMVIFAAEVAAIACTFIFRHKLNSDLENSMSAIFEQYDGNSTDSKGVDFIQSTLQCCGVYNYTSWTSTTWFAKNNSVPLSCCKLNTTCSGRLSQPDLLYTEGCETKLLTLINESLTYAMLVVLGFAVIKFFGMLSVCVITCKSNSRRNGYEAFYG